jgi:hypothetical protein
LQFQPFCPLFSLSVKDNNFPAIHTQLITLILGENWLIFKPDVPADHEEYELRILMKQHQFFGPFPLSFKEIADGETLAILTHVMRGVPREKMKPFGRMTEREISEDKAFILNADPI